MDALGQCMAEVRSRGGWHWVQCSHPAKEWRVLHRSGFPPDTVNAPVCGIHARAKYRPNLFRKDV